MSSKPLLIDFPIKITHQILNKLDIFSILKLRKVCHSLRDAINKTAPKAISFGISLQEIDNGCWVTWSKADVPSEQFQIVSDKNVMECCLEDLQLVMKHHQTGVLQSVWFENSEGSEISDCLENLVASNTILHAKKVTFYRYSLKNILKCLPSLDADTLENISVLGNSKPSETNEAAWNKLVELEQWKKAKSVDFTLTGFIPQIQDFLHFSKVEIDVKMISVKDVVLVKEDSIANVVDLTAERDEMNISTDIGSDSDVNVELNGIDGIEGTQLMTQEPVKNIDKKETSGTAFRHPRLPGSLLSLRLKIMANDTSVRRFLQSDTEQSTVEL
ncbi:hypothetical protein GCK72_021459 [Caenorhabditis remanei]|uniref:F-box domain-containing protein n=1 Tax=Caenorhabditis remanei TaxID=31234 RepID=A0A6A5GJI3_CAERE|nr:hypothetical protein GCK72_021459 [Caenorhabditis remanei]KAF1754894.1 hypothetical protein GCK72_021459 [Caenorhabditis remanei]